ncbi:vWA domain-containing protein [Desulfitispora alkaliphila]|uniref:vWA domain-containing protein n=1 Tax=Desulfitispora alkaliphila TaxID=622674 RepID=UPI003D1E9012
MINLQSEFHLIRFIALLRLLGIRISTAEVIDGMSAISEVDLLNKKHFKAALFSTLVKEAKHRQVFDDAFEAYFSNNAYREEISQKWEQDVSREEEDKRKAENELQFFDQQLELTDEEKLTYSNMGQEDREKIQHFIEKSSSGYKVDENFKPIIENLVRGALEYWKRQLSDQNIIQPNQKTGDDEIDSYLNHINKSRVESDISLEEKDFNKITDDEIDKVELTIRKLSARLATKMSRRYRKSSKMQKVNVRKSIRDNLKYGGTLIKLNYKAKRKKKLKILILSDVSGSMARYAAFVVQFMYGISNNLKDMESYVFAENLEEVTEKLKHKRDFKSTMANLMNESTVWGEGTDIGASVNTLLSKHGKSLQTNTVVIILSDGKTINWERTVCEIKALKNRVKKVIWLNPLPQSEWEKVRALREIVTEVSMHQCNTLNKLENAITEQFL